jgi:hypothetical protein
VVGGPERFARAARPQQEKMILTRREDSRNECHSESQNGGIDADFKGLIDHIRR